MRSKKLVFRPACDRSQSPRSGRVFVRSGDPMTGAGSSFPFRDIGFFLFRCMVWAAGGGSGEYGKALKNRPCHSTGGRSRDRRNGPAAAKGRVRPRPQPLVQAPLSGRTPPTSLDPRSGGHGPQLWPLTTAYPRLRGTRRRGFFMLREPTPYPSRMAPGGVRNAGPYVLPRRVGLPRRGAAKNDTPGR